MPGSGVTDSSQSCSDSYSLIYKAVRRIPAGRVATYGQIATLAGLPGHARQVGYALSALSEDHDVPWHRVINAKGQISLRAETAFDNLQRVLLEAEGVVFDANGSTCLERFRWQSKPGLS